MSYCFVTNRSCNVYLRTLFHLAAFDSMIYLGDRFMGGQCHPGHIHDVERESHLRRKLEVVPYLRGE